MAQCNNVQKKRSREENLSPREKCIRFIRSNGYNCIREFTAFVDTPTKEAALRVSPSLVSLISSSGDKPFFWTSGFVIECKRDDVNDTFYCTVLTSASLLKLDPRENSLAQNLKVEVKLPDDNLCPGDIIAYDWHFNICAIKIQSRVPLPIVNIRCLDDTIQTIDASELPLEEGSFQLRPHSNLFKLFPGDQCIALGRFYEPSDLMVAPGKFSIDQCGLDCKELLRANCKITQGGIGGPMINLYGEVVGINFYAHKYTPFLPMNVVSKWWDHVKNCRTNGRPWLGMHVTNLFAAAVVDLEKVLQKFPNISKGIIVGEVNPKSPAAFAGIFPNDVIVQIDGQDVGSCLELFDIIWGKLGKRVELVVARASNGARLDLSMVVGSTDTAHLNRWPLNFPSLKKLIYEDLNC